MQSIDAAMFLWLTAGPDASSAMVLLAGFLASAVVPLFAILLAILWVRGNPLWRGLLLDAVAAGLIGLGAVQVIGWLHYRPRPFEVGLGRNLMHHLPENSFPSDHATLMFALAFALIAATATRRFGTVILLLAGAVAWSRVFLGAHYPLDMLGGAALGLLAVTLVCRVPGRARLWAWLDAVYEAVLRRLNLPRSVFPRRAEAASRNAR